MHVYRKVLKGTSFLSASEVVSQACGMVRNIILARYLTKADFGVAAILGMVLTVFELSGKLALSQQVIQSKHGDERGFVASVQFTQFVAGAFSALLILAGAWPFAHFFSGPKYLPSIMALALIPLINGLTNLDVYRFSRRLSYGPLVLTNIIPQVITTVAAWPLAVWLGDYRAVLVLLLGKAFLSAVMTHGLAERRYSLGFNPVWFRECLNFGWPLLLNGFVQIGTFQGDSMVVAAAFPLAQLGIYSVALTIAMAPSMTILRIGSSLGLPLLAEVQSDVPRFNSRYGQLAQIMALIGCGVTLGMLFCGEQVVVLLFGAKYAGVGVLACWLTAAQSMRILRGATVIAAMARADTVTNVTSSLWRLSGLGLAIVVGVLKANIVWFAVAALAGEIVAVAATIVRLSSKHSVSPKLTVLPTALAMVCVLAGGATKWLSGISQYSLFNWLLLPVFLLLSAALFVFCFGQLRTATFDAVLHFRLAMGWAAPKENHVAARSITALSSDAKD